MGQVIGSDGKNYAAGSDLPDGVTAAAMIAYVNGENHGLAIALTDEGNQTYAAAKTVCEAKTPVFKGGTWKLPSSTEWTNMLNAFSGYAGLTSAFSTAGGTAFVNGKTDYYWSSTVDSGAFVHAVCFYSGSPSWASLNSNSGSFPVRAVLAF